MPLDVATRIVREAVRDKSYQLTPLGDDVAGYLRSKRKRLTDASFRDYESILDKLCRHFADKKLAEFEPTVGGTELLEEFLDHQWGEHRSPRTHNKAHSVIRDFFQWHVKRGDLYGDPTLLIERAKTRGVHRTVFTDDQRCRIIAENESLRDKLALRLLLDYGLRKGALRSVQFNHFDHQRRRLVIFTKGGKVREVPIPDPHFWMDLEGYMLETAQQGHFYLLCARNRSARGSVGSERPLEPMSSHGVHKWWYRCLENAGVVPIGTTSGERMHKARHTAGQRVLDASGNLKAVQKLLGHSSIATTGDVYADWDIDALASTMAKVLGDD